MGQLATKNTPFADPAMRGSFRQIQPFTQRGAVWQKKPSFWSFLVLADVFDAKVKVLSEATKLTSRIAVQAALQMMRDGFG